MTDRKNLEEALTWLKSPSVQCRLLDCLKYTDALQDAAEAHLATLPKPKWKVRVWLTEIDGPYQASAWSSQADALTEANVCFASGARKVEIEAP